MDEHSYSLWSAVSLGLEDSLNPCSFSIILMFLIFLVYTATSRRRFLMGGCYFIVAVFLTKYFQVLGTFDRILAASFINPFLRVSYLLVAFIFLIVGANEFCGWFLLRKQRAADSLKHIPIFLTESYFIEGKKSFLRNIGENAYLFVVSWMVGFFLTFMTVAWPQNYYLFIVYFSLRTSESLKGQATFLLYSFSFVLVMIVSWFLLLFILDRQNLRKNVLGHYALVKVVSSAVFIGLGAGLFYLFIFKA